MSRISVALALTLVAVSCSSAPRSRTGASTTSTSARVTRRGPTASIEAELTGGQGASLVLAPKDAMLDDGYTEHERLATGTARSFRAKGTLADDGRWRLAQADTASFTTRVVAFTPPPTAFNGTVIVEWLNVTSGFDLPVDLIYLSPEIRRSGAAWVGVSTQKVGVDALRTADPARYGSLSHPGGAYAFDIFTQVGRALRENPGSMLGGLTPERFIATGDSQSAWALTTYINGMQPTEGVFDGFFVHSRFGGAMPLDGAVTAASPKGSTKIRADIGVPVLMFETETDLAALDYFDARQPDAEHIRTWEVAGASHTDSFVLPGAALGCVDRINEAPTHFVVEAAFDALDAWVRTGRAPRTAPRLDVEIEDGAPVVQRNDLGIAIGGIRTAPVDVPIAVHSGVGTGNQVCTLVGRTTPLAQDVLNDLYPSQQAYLDAFTSSTDRAIAEGHLLAADRAAILSGAGTARTDPSDGG